MFALALGLAIGWAGALLLSASPITDTISQGGLNLLTGVGGAMIGVVGTYVGTQIFYRHRRGDDARQDERPPSADEDTLTLPPDKDPDDRL